MKIIFYWLPRILAILYTAFISLFALDVFGEPQWFLALVIHLIPSFVLILLTVVAWKHERIGGFLFLAAGFAMVSFFHSFTIAAPAFAVGALFLAGSYWIKA